MSAPTAAVPRLPGFGIEPATKRSLAPARGPASAGPLSSVNHILEMKPVAIAASPAAIDPAPDRTKSLPVVTIGAMPAHPGTPPPQSFIPEASVGS